MLTLAQELKHLKGKKQYGYLPVKKQVDEIVDQMARLSSVKKYYEKWLELQQEINEFYSGKPLEPVPLSQQKEFRAIHNAIITPPGRQNAVSAPVCTIAAGRGLHQCLQRKAMAKTCVFFDNSRRCP